VLTTALNLGSEDRSASLKEQQNLIKVLNEERKDHERRFHKLTTEHKTATRDASAPKAPKKELPSSPAAPSLEAIDEEPKARGRVWIKDESPDRKSQSTQNSSSTPRESSATLQTIFKVRGRARVPDRIPDSQDDDSSLLDMTSFLKSTGPDTPRSSGEDSFSLPTKPKTSRSRLESRDPVVRNDSSDLINFFREGLPRIVRKASVKTPRSTTPVRRTTDPVTPPPTAREELTATESVTVREELTSNEPTTARQPFTAREPLTRHKATEKEPPLPPLPPISPKQIHIRSRSAGLPAPLGSHPPQPQFTTSQPTTAKWPLQAVLAWLEQKSFSAEWQETFRILQIEGSEFVELESGQSIRKMLTIIYPQLAKECVESGKGWDQARERAEGQRLRKLIRELPADIKYEDRAAAIPEKTMDERPADRSPAKTAESAAGGRRRAATAPAEDTNTRSTQAQTMTDFLDTESPPLPESEQEEQANVDTAPAVKKEEVGDQRRGRGESETSSNVPDEWVRKWTVLSPEEIDRGRQVASTWLVD
jgi:hypothetical protein